MRTKLLRVLPALLMAGTAICVVAPAHAADAPEVTAFNYVINFYILHKVIFPEMFCLS